MWRSRDETRGNPRTKDTEAKQCEARKDEAHRIEEVRLLDIRRSLELGKEAGTDPDNHRQHHHFDAGGDDVSKHSFGKEAGPVPQSERDQDEPGQSRQFEFDDGDEELDREDEESEDYEQPGNHQHGDGQEILEKAGDANQLAHLVEQRLGGIKAGRCNEARL